MERKIYLELLQWKNSADRKPLILQGARQVGKTYIVNYFAGKEYRKYLGNEEVGDPECLE